MNDFDNDVEIPIPPERLPDDGKGAGRNGKPLGRKGGDAFVIALATGLSVPQAAERAGIGTSTAYRRLEDPAYRKAVTAARDDLLSAAVSRLVDASLDAVDALRDNLRHKSASVRTRAAQTILTNMIHGASLTELLRRIEALEDQYAP